MKAKAAAQQEHGSRIITALEAAWAAIRARHPEVPGVVIITGAGNRQRGVPEGYRLRGHHWPARWVTTTIEERDGELFIAGELLAAGGRAVIEVMLHEAAHALAAARGIKDTSAEGNRYHNKRFVALAAELGLRGPDRPENVIGWSDCRLTDETAAAYAAAIDAIDAARLPYLPDAEVRTGDDENGQDQGDGEDQDEDKPKKRGGRRLAAVCACQPPRKLHLTPKQVEDGPVICGLCNAQFEVPDGSNDQDEEN